MERHRKERDSGRVSLETSSIYNRPLHRTYKKRKRICVVASPSAMSYRRIELRDSKQPTGFIGARTASTNPQN